MFDLVCSCDLELDPYSLKVLYRMCENKLPMSRQSYHLTDRQTDSRQTGRQTRPK